MTEVAAMMDSPAAGVAGGPTDDYEGLHAEPPGESHKDMTPCVHDLPISLGGMRLTSRLDSARLKPLLLKATKQ